MRDGRDIARQVVVAASAVVAVVGSFFGSGAAGGTPIQDAAGGALAADATLIAPAGPAFAIWSVIYLGLLAYAVWQFLPSQSVAARHRRIGYWVAASLLLNAAWILSIQFDLLGLSVPIIVVLLAVLLRILLDLTALPATGRLDALLTDGSLGLYLGWVAIATAANVTALLVASGFAGFGWPPELWSVLVIALAAAAGVAIAIWGRGRIAPALSLGWGLAWVAVGRLAGEPASTVTAIAAIAAVVVVVGSAVLLRARRRGAVPAEA